MNSKNLLMRKNSIMMINHASRLAGFTPAPAIFLYSKLQIGVLSFYGKNFNAKFKAREDTLTRQTPKRENDEWNPRHLAPIRWINTPLFLFACTWQA